MTISAPSQQVLGHAHSLFFIHIPKTAGSTFVEFFRAHAPGQSQFWYSDTQRAAFLAGREYTAGVSSIAGGHFPLYQGLAAAGPGCTYLSFVRHPVDRLVSFYHFARRTTPKNSTAEAAQTKDFLGFLKFLKKQRPRILKNQQCRFLAAEEALHKDLSCCFEEVRKGWQGLSLVLLPSDQCSSAVQAVAAWAGIEFAGEPRSRKVAPAEDRINPCNKACDFILKYNEEDLKLFTHLNQRGGAG